MKKIKSKSLRLATESVRKLSDEQTGTAAGGTTNTLACPVSNTWPTRCVCNYSLACEV